MAADNVVIAMPYDSFDQMGVGVRPIALHLSSMVEIADFRW